MRHSAHRRWHVSVYGWNEQAALMCIKAAIFLASQWGLGFQCKKRDSLTDDEFKAVAGPVLVPRPA
jgi:hypothetical protein